MQCNALFFVIYDQNWDTLWNHYLQRGQLKVDEPDCCSHARRHARWKWWPQGSCLATCTGGGQAELDQTSRLLHGLHGQAGQGPNIQTVHGLNGVTRSRASQPAVHLTSMRLPARHGPTFMPSRQMLHAPACSSGWESGKAWCSR